MAKADGPQAETSLSQAGMPPSYGVGIQQGMYGGRGNPNFMQGGGGIGGGMARGFANANQGGYGGIGFGNSTSPSPDLLMRILTAIHGAGQGMNMFDQGARRFDPSQAGFNFNTPISSPNLFSGITNPGGQTTALGKSKGWSTRQTNNPQ